MIARANKFLAIFFLLSFFSQRVHAWGERGHNIVCEVAVQLVKNPQLKDFLLARAAIAGHLCNVPDIYWKDLEGEAREGDWSHFEDPENLAYKAADIPLDLAKINQEWQGKPSKELGRSVRVDQDLGTLWWRADQFYRRAIAIGKTIPQGKDAVSAAPVPLATPYDKAVLEFFVNLGLMGHFVGDNGMPYHNTADYDGWKRGHGGIHAYYESDCVNALPLQLSQLVWKKARTMRGDFLSANKSVLERMKILGVLSYSEIPRIEKLDRLLSSQEYVPPVGDKKAVKIKAKRPSFAEQAPRFESMIRQQLARSAALLALLWDEAYEKSGSPDLSIYRNYRYPFTPAYVAPDYLEKKISR